MFFRVLVTIHVTSMTLLIMVFWPYNSQCSQFYILFIRYELYIQEYFFRLRYGINLDCHSLHILVTCSLRFYLNGDIQ